MKKRNADLLCYGIIILLCIYILLPLFQIAQYNRPSADDYTYGLKTHAVITSGGGLLALLTAAWDTVVQVFTSFSGLYTSAFVLSLHPGIWGENHYILSTYIIFFVIYFCLFWSVYILNQHYVKRSLLFVFTASLVLETMLLLWAPSAWEALYWYNGAMNYMPFAFMNVLNLCVLLEADSAVHLKKGKILLGVSMVLSFLISGGNHVTAFANILMLLFAACYKSTKKSFSIFLPLLTACIGFAIMYLSPGTQYRQNYFVNDAGSRSAMETIIATIKHWIYVAGDWFSLTWLLSLMVITPAAMEIAEKNKQSFSKQFPFIPILMSGAVISGMFCVPYLPMGYFGEGRVTNVIWITFMLMSWLNYVWIWGWLAANDYVNLQKIFGKKRAALTGLLMICACLFALFRCHDDTMSNSMWAVHELKTGIAASYGQQMDDRISKYIDTSITEAAVAPVQEPSRLLFGGEISEDPEEWPNSSMGEWYGGKAIYVIPEAESTNP